MPIQRPAVVRRRDGQGLYDPWGPPVQSVVPGRTRPAALVPGQAGLVAPMLDPSRGAAPLSPLRANTSPDLRNPFTHRPGPVAPRNHTELRDPFAPRPRPTAQLARTELRDPFAGPPPSPQAGPAPLLRDPFSPVTPQPPASVEPGPHPPSSGPVRNDGDLSDPFSTPPATPACPPSATDGDDVRPPTPAQPKATCPSPPSSGAPPVAASEGRGRLAQRSPLHSRPST
ncbi:MAG: hypothetical protein K0V04_01440 [Deltaproteobacteria bacterium]|nr:hypothetical protein [Deltaproteobacteria bacterium]